MTADALYLVAGVALLLAVVLPRQLERAWLSAPVVLIALGALIGRFLPLPPGFVIDPVRQRSTVEHVTELTVIVALMGVGLALDRPLTWRSWRSWRSWSATWKLLGIAMPLCIGAVFLLGWGLLGIAAAPALLLAAALAPTDPVLASDVQVDGPTVDGDSDEEIREDDEVRFALTSEAGLNDGLAFPFVYAAIFLATAGPLGAWGWHWLGWELVGKTVVGILVGAAVGSALAFVAFRVRTPSLRLAEQGESLLGLIGVLIAYGAAEMAQGYGFLSVFVCAMAMRAAEPSNGFHEHLHGAIERLERLLTLGVLLFVGIGLVDGTLAHLDWRGVLIGLALIFVIRPLAGLVALSFGSWRLTTPKHQQVEGRERVITAFFGVRGVGTLYYLAYALGHAAMPEERWLWATATFTIVASALVHGILATPVLEALERRREAAHRTT